MALSSTYKDGVTNQIFNGAPMTPASGLYVSLHSGDPGPNGSNNEISGGSYVRQLSAGWTSSTGGAGATENQQDIDFVDMPAVTVSHAAVFDAASGGVMIAYGALTQARIVAATETFRFATGDVDFTLV